MSKSKEELEATSLGELIRYAVAIEAAINWDNDTVTKSWVIDAILAQQAIDTWNRKE